MYSNKDPEGGVLKMPSNSDKKFEKILIPLSNVKKGDSHVKIHYFALIILHESLWQMFVINRN